MNAGRGRYDLGATASRQCGKSQNLQLKTGHGRTPCRVRPCAVACGRRGCRPRVYVPAALGVLAAAARGAATGALPVRLSLAEWELCQRQLLSVRAGDWRPLTDGCAGQGGNGAGVDTRMHGANQRFESPPFCWAHLAGCQSSHGARCPATAPGVQPRRGCPATEPGVQPRCPATEWVSSQGAGVQPRRRVSSHGAGCPATERVSSHGAGCPATARVSKPQCTLSPPPANLGLCSLNF